MKIGTTTLEDSFAALDALVNKAGHIEDIEALKYLKHYINRQKIAIKRMKYVIERGRASANSYNTFIPGSG